MKHRSTALARFPMTDQLGSDDPATQTRIEQLVAFLSHTLSEAYAQNPSQLPSGSEPLRSACERYGSDAASAGIPLEEAMAGAIGALPGLFDRSGGHASGCGSVLAAGRGLCGVWR